jgi:polynucleotide 5'-hydroxyl-kinase GRC3/NOL9
LKFVLQAGKTLLISGPASLRLEKGSAGVFGAPLRLKRNLIIRRERQLPIETVDESVFDAELGEKASYLEVDGSTVPESWYLAYEAFQKLEAGRAVVIGSTDTGKSTFCTFLTNHTLKQRDRIAVIDADIGQSDLGPPGSLGLSIISKPLIELGSSNVDAMVFIGETSPGSVIEKVIEGIMKLQTRIPSNIPIVINTDGWVSNDEAAAYKLRLLKELKPDLVAGLAESSELDQICQRGNTSIMKVKAPKFIKARGREERRSLREYGYRKYLRDAIHKNFSLENLKVDCLMAARPERGEILGFLDGEGFLVGIGVLENLNRTRRLLRAYTSVSVRSVAEINCGRIRLSFNGEELGWPEGHRPTTMRT